MSGSDLDRLDADIAALRAEIRAVRAAAAQLEVATAEGLRMLANLEAQRRRIGAAETAAQFVDWSGTRWAPPRLPLRPGR